MSTDRDGETPELITQSSITEFFRDCVSDAVQNQHVDASDDALQYVVSLLTDFSRSSQLFANTPDGIALEPVADLYREYIQSRSPRAKVSALRRMGDIALFVAGNFSAHLARRGLSTDYYIAMGGSAYDCLAEQRSTTSLAPVRGVFRELARKFDRFVDVVAEVSEAGQIDNDGSILKVYETWIRTGDRRSEIVLRRAGIFPISDAPKNIVH